MDQSQSLTEKRLQTTCAWSKIKFGCGHGRDRIWSRSLFSCFLKFDCSCLLCTSFICTSKEKYSAFNLNTHYGILPVFLCFARLELCRSARSIAPSYCTDIVRQLLHILIAHFLLHITCALKLHIKEKQMRYCCENETCL